eukprot:TRINITY_DN5071_c0_g1_i1.p1 TRINITY_DN5071_c0_g1~~TRINITY_DN5071_c0_g1_i1.p1  ORF type:complete len:130 (+),score=19.11 TRINITY_DN5071_c0_g1_i1:339-728(+)
MIGFPFPFQTIPLALPTSKASKGFIAEFYKVFGIALEEWAGAEMNVHVVSVHECKCIELNDKPDFFHIFKDLIKVCFPANSIMPCCTHVKTVIACFSSLGNNNLLKDHLGRGAQAEKQRKSQLITVSWK